MSVVAGLNFYVADRMPISGKRLRSEPLRDITSEDAWIKAQKRPGHPRRAHQSEDRHAHRRPDRRPPWHQLRRALRQDLLESVKTSWE